MNDIGLRHAVQELATQVTRIADRLDAMDARAEANEARDK